MLQEIINNTKLKMNNVITNFEGNLKKISTGFAAPSMLDGIHVDYYGTPTPIDQMASIAIPDARQILIKPFDKTQIEAIVNAINSLKSDLNANDSGDIIRINVPRLTEDTRQREAKKVSVAAENAKIIIRQIRQDANNKIKISEATEDDKKGFAEDVQELVKEFNNKIDEKTKEKQTNILKL